MKQSLHAALLRDARERCPHDNDQGVVGTDRLDCSCRDPHLGAALSLTGHTLEVRGSLQLGFHRQKA